MGTLRLAHYFQLMYIHVTLLSSFSYANFAPLPLQYLLLQPDSQLSKVIGTEVTSHTEKLGKYGV